MGLGRSGDELTVMEAVDILSNMSEIDLKSFSDEEPLADKPLTTDINWRNPKEAIENVEILKQTFDVLHRYLQNIVHTDPTSLKDPHIQKGIQAIMVLASESTQKMDRFAALYPGKYKPISHLKEYEDLHKYYLQQILNQMPPLKDQPEGWEDEGRTEAMEIETQKQGLRDLEAVRRDLNYELFFIKTESDKPYYSKALLRHIRLVGNFDELICSVEGDDPLLQIRELLDRELHIGAKEVLSRSTAFIDAFYKEAMQHKDRPYVEGLNKAIMALRMASNPKCLIENESFKSCAEYYSDFHRFLREALHAPGYKERIEGSGSLDPFSHALLSLTHALCGLFFLRIEPREESLALLHEMVQKGDEMRGSTLGKTQDPWEVLAQNDESIRYLLKHYPNGPLMRTLDAFREEEEFEGYDPLTHFNFPSQLYTFSRDDFHVTVLRLPCPIKQTTINSCEIADELDGFLRYYKHELKPDRHMLINLQDRTSWKEHQRCISLEKYAKRAEFHDTITIHGLTKDSEFYHQYGEYDAMSGSAVFLEQMEMQLRGGHSCGFTLPEMDQKEVKKLLKVVHKCFFGEQTHLSTQERKDFIEITYALLILKEIERDPHDSISFTCKDAVDIGAAQSALFYGILLLLSDAKAINAEAIDQIIWMLYAPALLVRERCLLKERFDRVHSALQTIHAACQAHEQEVRKGVNSLFSKPLFPLDVRVI